MRLSLSVLLILFCLLTACESYYFTTEKDLEEGEWRHEDPFAFEFTADDTTEAYHFLLEIEHTRSYPYQNIYFQVQTVFPEGDTAQDLFTVNLADKFGNWNGECWGDECSLEVPIQQDVKFRSVGKHSIRFRQYSRKDTLKGIEHLAFHIERKEPSGK